MVACGDIPQFSEAEFFSAILCGVARRRPVCVWIFYSESLWCTSIPEVSEVFAVEDRADFRRKSWPRGPTHPLYIPS